MGGQSSKTKKNKEFSWDESSSDIGELLSSSDINKLVSGLVQDGVQAVDYSRYADAVDVANHPQGFDREDVDMAKEGKNRQEVQAFLALSKRNLERDYQIDAGFMGRDSGGHAVIVLRDYDLANGGTFSTFPSDLTVLHETQLSPSDNLRLLHLRYSRKDPELLELGLDPVHNHPVNFYRHVGLFRIRTSERVIRHMALQSCPAQHRLLVEDCATFARNFVVKLLHHLKNCGVVDEAGLQKQIARVVRYIHIKDGLVGESENSARENDASGESVHVSIVVAAETKRK